MSQFESATARLLSGKKDAGTWHVPGPICCRRGSSNKSGDRCRPTISSRLLVIRIGRVGFVALLGCRHVVVVVIAGALVTGVVAGRAVAIAVA